MMLEWIRVILGSALLLSGVFIFLTEILGVYRFGYVLNRMHAAATGDTLGISLSMLGLMVLSGWNFASLKMGLVVAFLWCSSPVSSHLIARLEVMVNEELDEECSRVELDGGGEVCESEGKNPGGKNLEGEILKGKNPEGENPEGKNPEEKNLEEKYLEGKNLEERNLKEGNLEEKVSETGNEVEV